MGNLHTKYGYSPDKEAIDRSLDLIASNLEGIRSDAVLRDCFGLMDLTSLSTADTVASITRLVEKVNTFRDVYQGYPLPASVCVYPNLAHVVRENRKDEGLHVTAVSGCFPTSQTFAEIKAAECARVVEDGADEVDIVLALNKFLAGDYKSAAEEIALCRKAVDEAGAKVGRKVVLKVIIESGLLSSPEAIADASFLAM